MPVCLPIEKPTTLAGPQSSPSCPSWSTKQETQPQSSQVSFLILSAPRGLMASPALHFPGRTLIGSPLVRWPCLDQSAVTNEVGTWGGSGAKNTKQYFQTKESPFWPPRGLSPSSELLWQKLTFTAYLLCANNKFSPFSFNVQWSKHYYAHSVIGKTEAHRGCANCPRSQLASGGTRVWAVITVHSWSFLECALTHQVFWYSHASSTSSYHATLIPISPARLRVEARSSHSLHTPHLSLGHALQSKPKRTRAPGDKQSECLPRKEQMGLLNGEI